MPRALYPHQRAALEQLEQHDQFALLLSVGTGKTATILHHIHRAGSRALIVAPPRVALSSWEPEIEAWDLPLQVLQLADAGPTVRERRVCAALAAGDAGPQVWICTYDRLGWLATELEQWRNQHESGSRNPPESGPRQQRNPLEAGQRNPFEMVVLDEATFVKSCTTARWRHAMRVAKGVRQRYILSGSLAAQSWVDCWAPLSWMSNGTLPWIGRDFWKWRDTICEPVDPNSYRWQPKPRFRAGLARALAKVSFSVDPAVLELPPVIPQRRVVRLVGREYRRYSQLRDDWRVELPGLGELGVEDPSAWVNLLRQTTTGAVYSDTAAATANSSGKRPFVEIGTAKIDALAELLLEELGGENVIIVYQYRHELARIQRRWPHARLLRNRTDVNAWNAGRIPLLCLHPASAGHGLNLQHGGRALIWLSQTWSVEHREQTIGRLTRPGQRRPVLVFDLLCRDTIDEAIYWQVQRKESGWHAVLRSIQQEAA